MNKKSKDLWERLRKYKAEIAIPPLSEPDKKELAALAEAGEVEYVKSQPIKYKGEVIERVDRVALGSGKYDKQLLEQGAFKPVALVERARKEKEAKDRYKVEIQPSELRAINFKSRLSKIMVEVARCEQALREVQGEAGEIKAGLDKAETELYEALNS